jgi:ATP-dependent DNA helicase RecG
MTIQPYSDDDLDRMLADLETDSSERKESFRGEAPRTVREAVCAFANDLAGHRRPGVVFIGVRDDGGPAGLAITDEFLRQLADIKTDGNIVPPPTMTVERRRLRGSRHCGHHGRPIRFAAGSLQGASLGTYRTAAGHRFGAG